MRQVNVSRIAGYMIVAVPMAAIAFSRKPIRLAAKWLDEALLESKILDNSEDIFLQAVTDGLQNWHKKWILVRSSSGEKVLLKNPLWRVTRFIK